MDDNAPRYVTSNLFNLASHKSRCVRWTPDGESIVSASSDGTIRIYKLSNITSFKFTSSSETELRGHALNSSVDSMTFNPTNPHELLSCSTDGTAKIWNIVSQKVISNIQTNGENLNVAWSSDGRTVAVADLKNVLNIISAKTGAITNVIDFSYEFNELAFAPNAPHMLCASTGKGSLESYDLRGVSSGRASNPKPRVSFINHGATALSLAFSPDGEFVATGGADAVTSVRRVTGMTPYAVCARSDSAVRAVNFVNGDSKPMIACGGEQGTIDIHLLNSPTAPFVSRVVLPSELNSLHAHPTLPIVAVADGSKTLPAPKCFTILPQD